MRNVDKQTTKKPDERERKNQSHFGVFVFCLTWRLFESAFVFLCCFLILVAFVSLSFARVFFLLSSPFHFSFALIMHLSFGFPHPSLLVVYLATTGHRYSRPTYVSLMSETDTFR